MLLLAGNALILPVHIYYGVRYSIYIYAVPLTLSAHHDALAIGIEAFWPRGCTRPEEFYQDIIRYAPKGDRWLLCSAKMPT